MQHIRPGQKAKIVVDAYPDEPIDGVVHNYAGTTGAKMSLLPPDNATGNFVKSSAAYSCKRLKLMPLQNS